MPRSLHHVAIAGVDLFKAVLLSAGQVQRVTGPDEDRARPHTVLLIFFEVFSRSPSSPGELRDALGRSLSPQGFGDAGVLEVVVDFDGNTFRTVGLDCDTVAVVLFCQCGSDCVDVKLWNGRRAQLQCYTCGQEAWLDGFTVSEFDPPKLLTAAVIDQARKHRKRPPDEVRRIEEHRKAHSR